MLSIACLAAILLANTVSAGPSMKSFGIGRSQIQILAKEEYEVRALMFNPSNCASHSYGYHTNAGFSLIHSCFHTTSLRARRLPPSPSSGSLEIRLVVGHNRVWTLLCGASISMASRQHRSAHCRPRRLRWWATQTRLRRGTTTTSARIPSLGAGTSI